MVALPGMRVGRSWVRIPPGSRPRRSVADSASDASWPGELITNVGGRGVQFSSGTWDFLLSYVIPISGQSVMGISPGTPVRSPSLGYLQNKNSVPNYVIAELALRTT